MAKVLPLIIIFFSGCVSSQSTISNAYKALRKNPTEENTVKFLSFKQEAINYLENLDDTKRYVIISTDDFIKGMIVSGKTPGKIYLHIDPKNSEIVIKISVEIIRKITFIHE